ncbi:hypothetical protein N2603_40205 [Bradyrhizobium huanghuaihaiense]|uniref:hypothetical protein n=1 Tax=Bradyrhizobium huanghuaihaiense TaxID=990078 RepID=UPI0021AA050D|nr:hypothetical protein [Bradyrhizobium sp. CB3035]UWU76078.1 hypothetical protein N2603_40205 [Bradyrhizobium sp. CB3035]
MDRFNTINPADAGSVASDATVEQPQAAFEQHLADAGEVRPVYPHAALYDVTEEDDRLIQAASGAALERGIQSPGTVSIYDRRLRKLAELLKKSGKSMAWLDGDTLLGHARKLLPTDKVIAPALSMLNQYLEPEADAAPLSTHYRPSREDESFIRKVAKAGFCRAIGESTAGGYASGLRKLAAALRPLSIAKLSDDTLLRHACTLFPKDKPLIAALNGLRHYRAITRQNNLGEGGSSRQVIQPPAPSPMRPADEQPMENVPDGRGSLPPKFNTPQVGHAMGLPAHSPIQNVAQNVLFDAADREGLLPATTFDAPAPSPTMSSIAHSPLPSVAQDALFDAADREGLLPTATFDAPVPWPTMSSTFHSPEQSVAQDALFDAADREGLLPAATFDAPVPWPTMSSTFHSPVQSVAQEALFDAADREDLLPAATFDAPVPWPMTSSIIHSPVQSVAQETLFDAADREGLLPATTFDTPVPWPTTSSIIHSPVQSVAQEALFDAADREGLLPATTFDTPVPWPTMGSIAHSPLQRFAEEQLFDDANWQSNSRQPNSASEDHFGSMMNQGAAAQTTVEQRFPVASDTFDASLTVGEDFSHGTQAAPDMMRTKLGRWGFLPDAAQRIKTYDIHGERYAAVLGPGGPNDVQLIHLRSPAAGDTFDVSFAVPKDFSHRSQLAPDMLLSTLGKWDFLPVAEHPIMNYEIGGERYTAILGSDGPNDVQLVHHPRSTMPGEATPVAARTSSDVYGGLGPRLDSPAPFEWREAAPSAPAPNLSLPSAAPASGHQPPLQVPELGELFGHDWTHGPKRPRLS